MDLKVEAGREVLWKLIDEADVLLQNFRPGAMDRMGFGESTVLKRNGRLIYVSISGFGESGPYAAQRVTTPLFRPCPGRRTSRLTGRRETRKCFASLSRTR